MEEIHAVVQCAHRGGDIAVEGEPIDTAEALHVMTNGFRIVFGRVFDGSWRLAQEPADLRWLDEDVRLSEAYALHSGHDMLEGLEGDNWLLVMRLGVSGDARTIRDRMTAARSTRGKNADRRVFDELVAALGDGAAGRYLRQWDCGVPDAKITPIQAPEEARAAMPLLAGFYYLGLMTVHRIDRDQARVALPIDPGVPDEESIDFIARTRVRLANVNRYFLTTNRSQNGSVKGLCASLATAMDLERRSARQVSIHHDLERHLDNVAQIAQVFSSHRTQEASERTNRVLFYLTVVGMPLAVFSSVMAFSLDAPLVREPDRWPTWASFLVAFGASASVSLILLGIIMLLSNGRRARRGPAGKAPGG